MVRINLEDFDAFEATAEQKEDMRMAVLTKLENLGYSYRKTLARGLGLMPREINPRRLNENRIPVLYNRMFGSIFPDQIDSMGMNYG